MWAEILLSALRELRRKPLRSFLTSLGVMIGVASVITMVTLGTGATVKVQREISKLGKNLLIVRPGQFRHRGVREEAPSFEEKDVVALSQIRGIKAIAPASAKGIQVIYGNKNWQTTCRGSTSAFLVARDWELASGRAFTEAEERLGKAVCLLGHTVKEKLFGGEDPLGATIRIGKVAFRVIGVLEEKGASFGPDADDLVLVPLKTFQRRISGKTDIGAIYISVQDRYSIDQVKEEVRQILRKRRRIGPNEAENFEIRDLRELIEAFSRTSQTLTSFLGAVAAVSLFVGGIGIMNIMLVSVTERTREIGLRLALGATERDVLVQFLVEAIVLSLSGGLVGIGLAMALSAILSRMFLVPLVFKPEVFLLALGFSAAVGIFFGYFPAQKAARLNPIEALRHE